MGSKKCEVDTSNIIGKRLRSGRVYLDEIAEVNPEGALLENIADEFLEDETSNAAANSRGALLGNVSDEFLKDETGNWTYWNSWNYSESDLSWELTNTVPFPCMSTSTLSSCISPAIHTSTPRNSSFETGEMSGTETEPPATRTDTGFLNIETLPTALGVLRMDEDGEGMLERGGAPAQ